MSKRIAAVAVLAVILWLSPSVALAQPDDEPGRSIGKVSVQGDLIVVELNDGALGKTNLFDLSGHTLRFVPEKSAYRVESGSLRWNADYGPELTGAELALRNFAFPFSGKSWKSFLVGTTGSIRFGVPEKDVGLDPYGHRDGGIILERFDQLAEVASKLNVNAPAICVLLKPRLSGPHYVNELSDRVVITWDLTEPFGGLLDYSWTKTANQFQAVLYRDGSIEMSYKEIAVKDAIVGIYPSGAQPAAVHFSALSHKDGPFAAPFEAFHYLTVPRPQDLSCTVITALGDKFDFLAYYSDFRTDSQEASPPSDGPIGGNVTGIGQTLHDQTPQILESRCTKGRFQLGLAQPVYAGANEAQEGPPPGVSSQNSHDISFYTHELPNHSGDGAERYNYAVGHLGHEVGHRWAAYASARSGGKLIPLASWPHWVPGLQTRVAFPYSLAIEASTLGGGVWQENLDGTYTQLRDGFFVPAAGYSFLDLYLMGLLAADEVPDFFLLDHLKRVGKDQSGRGVFSGDRIRVTIQDVIAANGSRQPDAAHSQKQFNTGIVVVVEHGQTPSRDLIKRATGIRQKWIRYWETATGHRASMTASPR